MLFFPNNPGNGNERQFPPSLENTYIRHYKDKLEFNLYFLKFNQLGDCTAIMKLNCFLIYLFSYKLRTLIMCNNG